jgi:PadR family transcriptional regulator PadR
MGENQKRPTGVLQGTLDMLVLKALVRGPLHGYDVAEHILAWSGDVLRVEEGALYPALHRLELRGLLASEWGVSANNRRAKFYRLTKAGRKQLAAESSEWARLTGAVARVMEA